MWSFPSTSDYQYFIDSYISIVQNKFISYDNYPVIDGGSIRISYFPNLEIVSTAAKNANIPFWNTVLSTQHAYYAVLTPEIFRFQLYTTLAYGARGISWFTYFHPGLDFPPTSPIAADGNKRDTWYMLQDVNLQLHRIGPIYITLNHVNTFHWPNVPSGCKNISTSNYVQSISGGDFCVGEFYDPSGHPYIVLVNKSLTSTSSFNVTFNQAGTMYRVNSATGTLETLESNEKYLNPGEGMLITVQ
jgi:hypothetical protein